MLQNFILLEIQYNIPNQFGFHPNRCTTDAIQHSMQNLLKSMENADHSIGIFCDLSKAFDCVKHEILYQKLSTYVPIVSEQ